MNKYQEALNYLDWFCKKPHQEQQDLLQELIDKETPIKPKVLNIGGEESMMALVSFSCCGNSHYCFRDKVVEEKYCSNCGQKIDWSNEN